MLGNEIKKGRQKCEKTCFIFSIQNMNENLVNFFSPFFCKITVNAQCTHCSLFSVHTYAKHVIELRKCRKILVDNQNDS